MRIAVPNKGSLSEPAVEMLREAGYRVRRDSKELIVADPDNDVEFFFLRPKDISIYVGSGELDLGITGRDLATDSGAPVRERLQLRLEQRRIDPHRSTADQRAHASQRRAVHADVHREPVGEQRRQRLRQRCERDEVDHTATALAIRPSPPKIRR